jgi:hypothetical protein
MMTLSEVARISGAKPRSVQLWADAGVILPVAGTDREGSGRHRLFDSDEVILAVVMARFAAEQIAIGALRSFSTSIRRALVGNPLLAKAISGQSEIFLIVHSRPENDALVMGSRVFDDVKQLKEYLILTIRSGSKSTVISLSEILSVIRNIKD